MTTFLFSQAAANPSMLQNFDPTVDVLLFDTVDPTQVKVSGDALSVTFLVGEDGLSFSTPLAAVTSGASGWARLRTGSSASGPVVASVSTPVSTKEIVSGVSTHSQWWGCSP